MSTETQEVSEVENVSHETTEETNDNQEVQQPINDKPPGYYPVDFDGVPEDKAKAMRERYDYFFKQDKQREKTLREYREIAASQAEQISQLTNGVGQIVNHLETKNFGETETQIRQKMQAAFDSGDNKGYVDAQVELNRLLIKQEAKPKPQQNQQNNTQRQAYAGAQSAGQLANESVQDGEITPQQASIVNSWQNEADESGQPLRPWAKNNSPNPNRPNPDFVKANLIALEIFEENPHRTVEENLMEVDKRMGTKKSAGKQTVMGGSFTTPQKTGRISLSPEMQKMAIRTKFGARDGAKTDAEYLEAYRKQIQTTRQKGAR